MLAFIYRSFEACVKCFYGERTHRERSQWPCSYPYPSLWLSGSLAGKHKPFCYIYISEAKASLSRSFHTLMWLCSRFRHWAVRLFFWIAEAKLTVKLYPLLIVDVRTVGFAVFFRSCRAIQGGFLLLLFTSTSSSASRFSSFEKTFQSTNEQATLNRTTVFVYN